MVYRNDLINKYIVAYTPLYFSKTVCKFLQFPNTIVSCSVLENVQAKGPGYGMGIPVTCTLWGPRKFEGNGCLRTHPYQRYEEKVLEINMKCLCLKWFEYYYYYYYYYYFHSVRQLERNFMVKGRFVPKKCPLIDCPLCRKILGEVLTLVLLVERNLSVKWECLPFGVSGNCRVERKTKAPGCSIL